MSPTLSAHAPADPSLIDRAAASATFPRAEPDAESASAEPFVPKLRGVPLILTWVVLAGAPWVAVWQVIKHAL